MPQTVQNVLYMATRKRDEEMAIKMWTVAQQWGHKFSDVSDGRPPPRLPSRTEQNRTERNRTGQDRTRLNLTYPSVTWPTLTDRRTISVLIQITQSLNVVNSVISPPHESHFFCRFASPFLCLSFQCVAVMLRRCAIVCCGMLSSEFLLYARATLFFVVGRWHRLGHGAWHQIT